MRHLIPILLLIGCGTIPDLAPFADATATLQQGVTRSQAMFRDEVLTITSEAVEKRPEFDKHWAKRRAALDSLVEYADALASIAEAGKQGKENAQALGAAVGDLFGKFGATGIAGSEVFQKGASLYGLIAEAAASASLAKAVKAAHPAIARITEILERDVESLRRSVLTGREAALSGLEDSVSDRLENRDRLVEHADVLLRETEKALVALERAQVDLAAAPEGADNLVALRARVTASQARVDALGRSSKTVQDLIAGTREWHEPFLRNKEEIESRSRAIQSVLQELRVGFPQLRDAHASIGKQIEENRSPNVRALLNTAFEIRSILAETEKKQ